MPTSNVTELPVRPHREPRLARERVRMSGQERREQLLDVGRRLFGQKGFEAVSVEEIASKAGVSKPVVYEHFGGKEGLYAVVVDREMTYLLVSISEALGDLDEP
ncbi:MAG: TetR/AcrR family transcriptional regulator, partial [Actinomycetales bacterium]